MSIRKFLPHELNLLRKYGFNMDNLNSIGEMPAEYITGHAEFCGKDFLVTSDTLIPRLETEEIITLASSFIFSLPNRHFNIADIGTGSGCIGITLAQTLIDNHYNNFDIYLSDISSEALSAAKTNSQTILGGNQDNIHFLNSNLFDQYPPSVKFDLIISNLPYIPSGRIMDLDSSVKDFEPKSALDGGPTGTEVINQFLNFVPGHLQENFLIILEIDFNHRIDMFTVPDNMAGTIKKDAFGNPRFLIITPRPS